MRRHLTALTVLAFTAHSANALSAPADTATDLIALERRVDSADLHPSVSTAAFLDSAIAKEFVLTGASGRRLSKRQALARWTHPDSASRPIASTLSGIRLVLAGDAAYITAISTETERRVSGDTTFALRLTDVWVRRDVRWQLVAGHVSRVPLSATSSHAEPVVLPVAVENGTPADSAALIASYHTSENFTRAARIARYDSTIAEDFMSARSDGTLSGKEATIARWTPAIRPGPAGGWSQVSNLQVRTYGGLAVVLLTDTQYDTTGRVSFVAHTTDVQRKEHGRWRLAALQLSICSDAVVASEDSAVVVALEHAIVHGSARSDRASLDTLIDSTFVGILPNGRRYGKIAAIAHWTSPDTSGETSILSNIVVHTSSDGALVEMVDTQHARDGNALRASRTVDLFVHRSGERRLSAGLAWPERSNQIGDAFAENAVRTARSRWNAAIVRDTAALATLLADSVVQASPSFRRTGRSAYLALATRIATRSHISLRFEPDSVRATRDVSLESGHWTESWDQNGERTQLTGRYDALWRKEADGWKLFAELFIPLACTGVSYCSP